MTNEAELIFTRSGVDTRIIGGTYYGYQKYGISSGGPMDRGSAFLANSLVGNRNDSPVLEISLYGPEFLATEDCYMALTGADLSATINGEPFVRNTCIKVEGGAMIRFGKSILGCRAYLAVGGTWKVTTFPGDLFSLPGLSGGHDLWSSIKKGMVVHIKPKNPAGISTPGDEPSKILNVVVLRLFDGPEKKWFSTDQLEKFYNRRIQVTREMDRRGCRLQYSIDGYNAPGELISSGTLPGTVQITHSGQPVLLLAACQTVGGYPRIGIVADEDLDKAGQLKPGDFIVFKPYSSSRLGSTKLSKGLG